MAALVSATPGVEDRPELLRRRALIRIREEDLLRLADVGTGYAVTSVHADWSTQSVMLAVVHPDLPPVPPGAQSPVLNDAARLVEEFRVIDDVLWRRCRLALDDPRVPAGLS